MISTVDFVSHYSISSRPSVKRGYLDSESVFGVADSGAKAKAYAFVISKR